MGGQAPLLLQTPQLPPLQGSAGAGPGRTVCSIVTIEGRLPVLEGRTTCSISPASPGLPHLMAFLGFIESLCLTITSNFIAFMVRIVLFLQLRFFMFPGLCLVRPQPLPFISSKLHEQSLSKSSACTPTLSTYTPATFPCPALESGGWNRAGLSHSRDLWFKEPTLQGSVAQAASYCCGKEDAYPLLLLSKNLPPSPYLRYM